LEVWKLLRTILISALANDSSYIICFEAVSASV